MAAAALSALKWDFDVHKDKIKDTLRRNADLDALCINVKNDLMVAPSR